MIKKNMRETLLLLEKDLVKSIESKIESKEPIKEVERVFNIYKQVCDKFGSFSGKYREVSTKYISYLNDRE